MATTTTFSFTGSVQTWVCPTSVTTVTIEGWGTAVPRQYTTNTSASLLKYDNTVSGINAEDAQAAIDELAALSTGGGSVTSVDGQTGDVDLSDSYEPIGQAAALGAALLGASRLIRFPSPGRLAVTGGPIGGLLVPVFGASTHAIPVGNQFLARCHHSGQTITWIGFNLSANALTAGQEIIVSTYEDAADFGPGVIFDSQSLVVGSGAGDKIFDSGVSLSFPTGPCWVSVTNPSTNAGTITIRSGTLVEPHFGVVQNGTWGGPLKRTGITSPAADLSSVQLRSSIASTEINVDYGITFPVLLGRTA